MEFSRELRDDVLGGDITLTVRLWKRPQVKPDRETLRRRAAHAGPIDDDTLVYRIEFHALDTGA